ncbi:MAG: hypothetical protein QM714_13945 [Nocardioides sp.]|uniref:hypothetical protein n=1 Tax=Nocardioides sp. TaxID=35761 RepID=UPI0039E5C8BA
MSPITRATAIAAGGALLATPAVLFAAPAHADVERHGNCGGGTYEFSVDREDSGRYEVSLDLDRVKPGSTWKVVLKQNGNRFFSGKLTTDHEGDLDVERHRANTTGKDTFKFKAKRVGHSSSCSRTITVA